MVIIVNTILTVHSVCLNSMAVCFTFLPLGQVAGLSVLGRYGSLTSSTSLHCSKLTGHKMGIVGLIVKFAGGPPSSTVSTKLSTWNNTVVIWQCVYGYKYGVSYVTVQEYCRSMNVVKFSVPE